MIQKTEEINGLYVTAVEKRKVGGTWYRVHKNLPDSVLEATVLVFDEPSEEYGIDGGRISKLGIMRLTCSKNSEICKTWEANYERGWCLKPTAGDAATFLEEIKELYK